MYNKIKSFKYVFFLKVYFPFNPCILGLDSVKNQLTFFFKSQLSCVTVNHHAKNNAESQPFLLCFIYLLNASKCYSLTVTRPSSWKMREMNQSRPSNSVTKASYWSVFAFVRFLWWISRVYVCMQCVVVCVSVYVPSIDALLPVLLCESHVIHHKERKSAF